MGFWKSGDKKKSVGNAKDPAGHRRRENANLFSKLLFWWTVPIIRLANERELETSDFDLVSVDDRVDFLATKLSLRWNEELKCAKPSLLKAILLTFWRKLFLILVSLCWSQLVLKLGTPVILGFLLRHLADDEQTTSLRYPAAGLYLSFIFATTLLTNPLTIYIQHCGAKARISLSGMLYQKVLKLNQKSLASVGVGHVTNLVSNDLSRFDHGTASVSYALIAPFQIIVAGVILWQYVGVSLIPALVLMLFLALYQGVLSRIFASLRIKIATRTDNRIRLISELITGLCLVKLFMWEGLYTESIATARKREIGLVLTKTKLRAVNTSIFEIATNISVLLTFLVYILLGNHLTTDTVFVVLCMFSVIGVSGNIQFPIGAAMLAEILISIKRVQAFLLLEEKKVGGVTNQSAASKDEAQAQPSPVPDSLKIEVENLSARWSNTSPLILTDLSLSAKSEEFVGIVGQVGSGKSSLLLALLSELPAETGKVTLFGSIAYVPQQSWLLPGTIRDNILFGLQYEPGWYETVIEACALTRDFENLEHGDQTIVGENGINLSGGQKARINLARACYSNAEIYLLDDPISAVDPNVVRHLMEKCIHGILKSKCVVLATHQSQYLQSASRIITLGSLPEVQNTSLPESVSNEATIDELFELENFENEKTALPPVEPREAVKYGTFGKPVGEMRSVGKVSLSVYKEYLTAGNSWFSLSLSLLLLFTFQAFMSGSDLWLKTWTDLVTMEFSNNTTTSNGDPKIQAYHLDYVTIYALLILGVAACSFSKSIKIFTDLVKSSISLHSGLVRAVIGVPMQFLKTNTPGAILNRFTLDIGIMDELLPFRIYLCISNLVQLIGSCVVVCILSPTMLIPTGLMFIVTFFLIKMSLGAAATTKRLEGICRSSVLTQLSTTMSGLPTIRAYQKQSFCTNKFENAQNNHTPAFLMYLYTARWLMMTAELLGDIYASVVIFFLLMNLESSSTIGLVASSLLTLIFNMSAFASQVGELSSQMTSVERVIEFTKVKPEGLLRTSNVKLLNSWPDAGNLRMDNLCVRYDAGPMILKNITMDIKPKEKIGIIGRTGAGKSTLIAALFRIVNKNSGFIHIDSIDLSRIGLHDLREKISIVPQNPFLFSGTLRKTLDPFGRFTDVEIWEALKTVQLFERMNFLPAGLDTQVADGGLNFSQGERQLLCIARTILVKNKFLVLDEATSSIDSRTDKIIQGVIRERYQDCTVLTIAHRLDTVMDSDRILVLDSGSIVEFDDPATLLENQDSYFYRLVQRTRLSGVQQSNNSTT